MQFGTHGKRERGVTLIELMVALVVVSILASVAVGSYRQYTLRAGRAEAMTALLQAQNNLERCFTRFNRYDPTLPEDDACVTLADNLEGDGIETEGGRYVITAALDATTYRLQADPRAGGGMTDDARCTQLAIDQAGQRDSEGSAPLDECWR
ncbi:MAG: prepilin-type N-terminal cleavage/methylation domain-containing protein [Steroidobacteraceae bacterium]|jgi:type IV pilus assembly protein PilE|nr:prepilin-type N-terminal cleavage/methylation domain-containing protein [Steroidobacteraceae bacterium]